MKKIAYHIVWILLIQVFIIACKEEVPEIDAPAPSEEQASFTATPTAQSDNIYSFSNTASEGVFLKTWNFGNGKTAEGDQAQVSYPFKGTYVVTLTVYSAGGSTSTQKTIVIEETDLSLLTPLEAILGSDQGKAWKIAAATDAHLGLGPVAGNWPEWYRAAPNSKSGAGLYDDRFIFSFEGLAFQQVTNGDVYVQTAHKDDFPGATANLGDFTAPYTAKTGLTWSVSEQGGKQYITINNGGWIGFYTGVSKYEVLEYSEYQIKLRFVDSKTSAFAWYHILEPVDAPPPPPFNLPINFEGTTIPAFSGFGDGGNTQYSVVANPDASGINTSAKVAKMVKGHPNWSGMVASLTNKLDFSTNTKIKIKVYSPVTGKAKFKLENSSDAQNVHTEVDAMITQTNQWQELTFDFSGAAAGTYNNIVIFMDFDNDNGGTFYVDDIVQSN